MDKDKPKEKELVDDKAATIQETIDVTDEKNELKDEAMNERNESES